MTNLKRTLGLADLTLLVIGNVIGSGIFLVPSTVLVQSGSVPASFVVWGVAGLLSLFGALAYGELGAMDQGSGGLYSFIRDALGRFPAFLYGWTLFFVIGSGTVATLAVAAANYVGQFAALTPMANKAVAAGLILAMMGMNAYSVRQSASVQNAATAFKVGAILLMGALLLTFGHGGAGSPVAVGAPLAPASLSSIGLATISVLWAYEGWQYVTFSTGEAVNPQRDLPRAIAFGTAALVAIYSVANLAYLAALGPSGVAASSRVASDAVEAVLGPAAGRMIALAILVSIYGAAHATVMTAPRVYYTMARDGVFFSRLAAVHPRFGTPAFAIVTSCLWSMVLALSGTFEQLLTYVVFVGWIFYALGAVSLIVLRHTRPEAPRPFRVPGYPLTPALFIAAAGLLVMNTVASQPREATAGLGVVLLGVPAYWLWQRAPHSA